jgi:hypothetical protein
LCTRATVVQFLRNFSAGFLKKINKFNELKWYDPCDSRAMVPSRASLALLAILSLGFLSHSPSTAPSKRWVASCDDSEPSVPTVPGISFLSPSMISMAENMASLQAAQAYALFVRQLQIDMAVSSFVAPSSILGYSQPLFPSYQLPTLNSYGFDMTRPDSSHQGFGGLLGRSDLQYLVRPLSGGPNSSVSPLAVAPSAGTPAANAAPSAPVLTADLKSPEAAADPAAPAADRIILPSTRLNVGVQPASVQFSNTSN